MRFFNMIIGYRGRHRGTHAQLIEQESALRVRAYALAMERRNAGAVL